MWCLRILHNSAGPTLNAFYMSISSQPSILSNTATIQPAIDFIHYLNRFAETNLFDIPLPLVRSAICNAMYTELTGIWQRSTESIHMHTIHTDWQPCKLASSVYSRITTSWYHDFACGHAHTRARLHDIGLSDSPRCRRGCSQDETVEHILVHCPFYDKERRLICKLCRSFSVDISLEMFLTDKRLHRCVEHLIAAFLKA